MELISSNMIDQYYTKQKRFQQSMQKDNIMHFLIFINTKSGNGDGKRFFQLGKSKLCIHFQAQSQAHLHFIDLFSADSRAHGLSQLHGFLENNLEFRVIVCGGDGTIPWVLNEILKEGISLTKVVLGIIPIGTGNDFSRSLGWGSETVKVQKDNYRDLTLLVRQWMKAEVGFYDMWDVTVQTFSDGKIFDIKNQRQHECEETSFTKMFSNYVGLGLDARVVYTMQRHRTPYAFLNKVAYGLVGCINCFRWMTKLQDKVESVTEGTILQSDDQTFDSVVHTCKITENSGREPMISKYPIENGKCGLVCLNCTSYMAGLRKVWQTKSIANVNIDKSMAKSYFKEQKVNDGMIQFVTFKNQLSLALERILRSGSKVFQGSGPYEIKMKAPKEQQITHIQIDGQSIKVVNLKSVIIRKTNRISDHKLRVMIGPLNN